MSNSTLTEIARVPKEAIYSISNFLANDGGQLTRRMKDQSDDDEPDTEECIDLDQMEMNDELSSDQADEFKANEMQRHWLRHTLVVASSSLDVLAIASSQKLVVLERRSSSMEICAKIKVTDEEHVYISAVSVIGIAPSLSNSSSKSLTTDWTCICIGLSNGQLVFYTEHGARLFSEKCASSQILTIRLGPSAHPGNQELVLLTAESKLVVIEGLSLCVALRTARTHIAHGDRSPEELSNIIQLNAQQLRLDSLRKVNDLQIGGLTKQANFDQYTGAFFAGGRNETITQAQQPIYAQYMCAVGRRGSREEHAESELVAFLWHNTQSASGSLTDALFSLTSKVTSNMPSFGFRTFLGVGVSRKDRPQKQWLAETPVTSIYVRSALRDGKRLTERTFLAPYGWNLCAVTDNIGRILLVHTKLRRILRVWKGYRQARCAWLEVEAPKKVNGKAQVKTLFLAIFAPKRGLLEIWSVQNGPRVSAFEVNDHGRLFVVPSAQTALLHGMEDEQKQSDVHQQTNAILSASGAVFLSPDGIFFNISVPFHLSALDASSVVVHDESLLKQHDPKIMEAKIPIEASQLMDWMKSYKTEIGKKHFTEMLLRNANISSQSQLLAEFIFKLAETSEETTAKEEPNFRHYIGDLQKVIGLYNELDNLNNKNTILNQPEIEENDPFKWSFTCTQLSDPNVGDGLRALEMLIYLERESTRNAKFSHQFPNLQEFLHHFHPMSTTLKNEVVQQVGSDRIGAHLFVPFLSTTAKSADIDDSYRQILTKNSLQQGQLLNYFLSFWLNERNRNPENLAERSYDLLELIFCFNQKPEEKSKQFFAILKTVETSIFESQNTKAAMILALQINNLLQKHLNSLSGQETASEGENFLVLNEQFMEMQANLENPNLNIWSLAALHLGAESLLKFLNNILPSSNKIEEQLNLSKLAQKGLGFYREQIAKFIMQYAIKEQLDADQILSLFTPQQTASTNNKPPANCQQGELDERQKVCLALDMLCTMFPQSLRMEFLASDLVWEFASGWYKNESRAQAQLNLSLSIELLERLQGSPQIQHGMAIMMWDAFLGESFKKLFHLMEEKLGERALEVEKRSKTPLAGCDWILKRDVYTTEMELTKYMACVRQLLEIMANASFKIEGRRDLNNNAAQMEDPAIKGFLAHKEIRNLLQENIKREMTTLVQMAAGQRVVNYHLVRHHSHLAYIIELELSLPHSCPIKPSLLFDANGKRAFFVPLTTHPFLPMSRVDDRTVARRQRFMENCTEILHGNDVENKTLEETQKIAGFHRLLEYMVRDWALDVANIKIKEIARLFLLGQDQEAEERCNDLKGIRRKLAFELIPIMAARIKVLIDQNDKLMDKILRQSAATESTLSMIGNAQEEQLPSAQNVDVEGIRRMIFIAKACLSTRGRTSSLDVNKQGAHIDYNKCQQILKEFEEICTIAHWFESNGDTAEQSPPTQL